MASTASPGGSVTTVILFVLSITSISASNNAVYSVFSTGGSGQYDDAVTACQDNSMTIAIARNHRDIVLMRQALLDNPSVTNAWIAGKRADNSIYFRTPLMNLLECFDWVEPYDWDATLDADECIMASQTTMQADQGAGPFGSWSRVPCTDNVTDVLCQNTSENSCTSKFDGCGADFTRNLTDYCFWSPDGTPAATDESNTVCMVQGGDLLAVYNQEEYDYFLDNHVLIRGQVYKYQLAATPRSGIPRYSNCYVATWGLWLDDDDRRRRKRRRKREIYYAKGDLVNRHSETSRLYDIGAGGEFNSLAQIALGIILTAPAGVRGNQTFLMINDRDLLNLGIVPDFIPLILIVCESKKDRFCMKNSADIKLATKRVQNLGNNARIIYKCREGFEFATFGRKRVVPCSCDPLEIVKYTSQLECVKIDDCKEGGTKCACDVFDYCECNEGYEFSIDSTSCQDIKECDFQNGGCQQICNEREGTFSCSCYSGFNPDPRNKYRCIDVDECEDEDKCEYGICVNEPGSYSCKCFKGFVPEPPDNVTCIDVNECEELDEPCPDGANCTNLKGSFQCDCPRGYTAEFNEITGQYECIDVIECPVWGCHICIDTPGSFECICSEGFELNDHNICKDIDECDDDDNGGCNYQCVNTFGSFYCKCPYGYRIKDIFDCEDIDECDDDQKCDLHHGWCENGPGYYTCHCLNSGYSLNPSDGKTCLAIGTSKWLTFKFQLGIKDPSYYEDPKSEAYTYLATSIEQYINPAVGQADSIRAIIHQGSKVEVNVAGSSPLRIHQLKDILVSLHVIIKTSGKKFEHVDGYISIIGQIAYSSDIGAGFLPLSNQCDVLNGIQFCINSPCDFEDDNAYCLCPEDYFGKRCDFHRLPPPPPALLLEDLDISLWNNLTISLVSLVGVVALLAFLQCLCFCMMWGRTASGHGHRYGEGRARFSQPVYDPKVQWNDSSDLRLPGRRWFPF